MPAPQTSNRRWLDEARDALADAQARSHPARAWDALQVRDAEGNSVGSLPYSPRAIEEFRAAHRRNPDDAGIVHHLAIALHARAWDLELAEDPAAAGAWAESLGYWRVIAFSRDFWEGMEAKLHACDPAADPEPVRAAQRNLLEDVLGVHVEFIRHHCETGAPERAAAHVRIIQCAQIPPAVKKRLEGRVLTAMTGSVAEAKGGGQYESAMIAVERFLELFPGNQSAIRMLAEIAKQWLGTLSWQHDWDAICTLHARVSAPVERGAGSDQLSGEPLLRSAIEDLALEFMMRGTDRGWPVLRESQSGVCPRSRREEALESFSLSLRWGRMAAPFVSGASDLRSVLAGAALGHASLLHHEAAETYADQFDRKRSLAAALELYRKLIAEIEEAAAIDSVEPELASFIQNALETWLRELRDLESKKSMADLGWGTG